MASYEAVYNEFYDNNKESVIMGGQITFEKKKDKWYVTTYQFFNNNKVDSSYLFFVDGHFVKLPPPSPNVTHTGNAKRKINDFQIVLYNLNQYYGYKGWYKDVIKDARLFKYTTDSAHYSLGRAYAALANGPLSVQYGDTPPEDIYHLELNNNCLNTAQIKRYDSLERLSIAEYKKTMQLNSSYQTFTGPVQIKYANEWVGTYHTLLTFAEHSAASFVLPGNIYPDSILNNCRQILMDCPKNAILLTYGDNDYYPILYLQKHDNIRRDVYLISSGLLSLDRYIYHYQTKQLDAKGIDMGNDDVSFYQNEQNNYIEIQKPKSDSTISIFELMKHLNENSPSAKSQTADKPESSSIEDLKKFITAKKHLLTASNIVLKIDKERKNDIKLCLEDTRFLTKDTWMLYIIIDHLNGRKLCTTTLPDFNLKNMAQYFKKSNSVYVLE